MKSAYAAICREEAIRMASSSGGVFSLIARDVLSRGGVVFGAAVTEGLQIAHICVESAQQLHRLRGSKYVRSQLADVYSQAKACLQAGRPVLFTGTPCQIGGLRAYLKEDYENLLCQDLICHGAPMASVWEHYVNYREKKAGAKAVSVNFRDKSTGWSGYSLEMTFENGEVYRQSVYKDPYMRAFLQDLSLGTACYSCAFKGMDRQADITLADFWGVEQLMPHMHDNKGTSLIFVHSEKGQQLLERIQPQLKLEAVDGVLAAAHNPAMLRPAQRPEKREAFLKEVNGENFEKVVNKYCPRPSLLRRVIRKLKRVIRK